ncbi:hypothetical protein Glove_541g45 [Diversispora epigaea]|uniref:Vacuolar protein sorting-associated protein 51 homolog n=1 Tax=Diversispora epigaea TaxID=1348612 RepID=A0A397GFB1_9GLOM|nr:hypothetical protein Glove_541g45 [Diversispora epigaea]
MLERYGLKKPKNNLWMKLLNSLNNKILRNYYLKVNSKICTHLRIRNLLKRFQIQFRLFWYSFITSMIKFVTPKIPLPLNQQQIIQPPSIIILIISRILLDFGEFVVTQVYTTYSERLYSHLENKTNNNNINNGRIIIEPINIYGEKFFISKELAQDVRGIVGFCKDVSQRVLERYLEITGNKLSKNIRDFYGCHSKNMKSGSSPSDVNDDDNNSKVSEIWIKAINELTFIEKMVMTLYGPHEEIIENSDIKEKKQNNPQLSSSSLNLLQPGRDDPPPISSSYSHSNSSFSSISSNLAKASPNLFASSANLMSNIDKLFSDRIEIFGIADFSKFGIMLGIIKIMLKTWIEMIRIQTLSRKTFQQIQIDSEYMRIKLWKFIEDERVLNTMLQELASSAFKRCAEDPAPLDNAVIEKIVGGL